MASQSSFLLLFALFSSFFISSSFGYTFYVGDKTGWTTNPLENYNDWAGRNRFSVNDTLVFKSNNGADSVLVVNKDDYNNCNTKNPIQTLNSNPAYFKFDRSGPFYFISGNTENCQKGQKVIVVVLAIRPIKPAPKTPPVITPPSSSPSPKSPIVKPPPGSVPAVSPVYPPGSNTPSSAPALSPKGQTPSVAPSLSPGSPKGQTPSAAPSLSPASPKAPSPSGNSPGLSPSNAPSSSTTGPVTSPSPSESTSPSPSVAGGPSPSTSESPQPATISPAPSTEGPPGPGTNGSEPVASPENSPSGNVNATAPTKAGSWTLTPSTVTVTTVVTVMFAFI